jgi:hypothetical protein
MDMSEIRATFVEPAPAGERPAASAFLTAETLGFLVKRHTHDLRNSLNGIEMELTLMLETEARLGREQSIRRVRREMSVAQAGLRSFSAKCLLEPRAPTCIADVAEQWMADARTLLPEAAIIWEIHPGSGRILVERQLLRGLLSDWLTGTVRGRSAVPIHASCRVGGDEVTFAVAAHGVAKSADAAGSVSALDWTLFQSFAARCGAVPEPISSPTGDRLACRLVFPLIKETPADVHPAGS